ncbi:MAG TPA: NAD(P)-dependent oxidoreductase [Flavobacteriales bacterium]|jgi:nucleoside-diphosphate-sugar epimerase|nr:NAD(P)-dependent oxidoreductase [Flavobacteriales bacterium]HOZ39304.1 NAD(P)-dependent oxidoreductase [Flavobacteriales bacterium]
MRILVTGGSGFIGTNFMAFQAAQGVALLNLDWNPPLDPDHRVWWKEIDLMDQPSVQAAFDAFKPTHVVHLAARTDTDEPVDVDAYRQNHEGTRILLEVVKRCACVERIVVTSTQFVCEAGYQPKNDLDFKPFTVYGESKRRTEMITREAALTCCWTIIRPTTIWGPWSLRYRDVMFKVMRKGLYFHPGKGRVVRSYGYVGNVVWQIDRMLHAPRPVVDGRVFYVGDRPFDLKEWVEVVSRELVGKPVRYIPTFLIQLLAWVGDAFKLVGIPFPITSGRFRSMTSDYITPMDKTIDALGEAPFSIEAGVKDTVKWYDNGSERIIKPVRIDVRQHPVGKA